MIDRKQFNDVFQYFDKEIIVEIIDMFISEHDERFRKMKKNLADNDFTGFQFNSHSKGVIANFWDPVTVEQSTRLDNIAKIAKEQWINFDKIAKMEIEAEIEKALGNLELSSALLLAELMKIKKEFT